MADGEDIATSCNIFIATVLQHAAVIYKSALNVEREFSEISSK